MAGKKFIIVGTNQEANFLVGNILLQKTLFKGSSKSLDTMKSQKFRGDTVVIVDDLEVLNSMCMIAEDPKLLFVVDSQEQEGSVALYEKIEDLYISTYGTLVLIGDCVTTKLNTDIERLRETSDKVAILKVDDTEPEQREKLLDAIMRVASPRNKRLPQASGMESVKMKFTKEEHGKRRPLFITIVGGSGTGKSSTGNTILGYNAYDTDLYDRKETPKQAQRIRIDEGKRIALFDTTGDLNKDICSDIKKKLHEQEGYHILLLVMKINTRMTEEELKRIGILKKKFDTDYLQKHLCIVFTHGDEYMVMHRQGRVPEFNKYIWSETGPVRDLLELSQGRCELVNNVATSSEKEEEYRTSVMDMMYQAISS